MSPDPPVSRDDLDIEHPYNEHDSAIRLRFYSLKSTSEPALNNCLQREKLFKLLHWESMPVRHLVDILKDCAAEKAALASQMKLATSCM